MDSTISIPNKSVFKLNEICGITGVKPYVIRFWESEFDEISPIVSSSGQKLYEHKDIETVSLVKKLLFEDKMTIEQAKFQLYSDAHQIDEQEDDADLNTEVIAQDIELDLNDKSESLDLKTITDLELQKLVLAKAKLNSIIGLIDRRKNFH